MTDSGPNEHENGPRHGEKQDFTAEYAETAELANAIEIMMSSCEGYCKTFVGYNAANLI